MEHTVDAWQPMRLVLQCLPRLSVSMGSNGRDPVVTLETIPSTPEESASEWVEALELLTLVWLVDPHKWRQLLAEKGRVWIRADKIVRGGMPVYLICWTANDKNDQLRGFLDTAFTPVHEDQRSDAFHQAKASLLLLAQDEDQRTSFASGDIQIQIPVAFSLGLSERDQRSTITSWYESRRDGQLRSTLASVSYFSIRSITPKTIGDIHDQVRCGIPLGSASVEIPRSDPTFSRHLVNQLFTDILGEFGASHLNIRHLHDRSDTMEAFLSKLTEPTDEYTEAPTRTLRFSDFRFGRSQAERRSALLWWVHGLFGPDARHTIHHLDLTPFHCGQLREEDIRWLAELLRTQGAPRPELFIADAFEEYASREAPHDQWLLVPSGYPIHVQLGNDSPDHTITFDDRGMKFRVLRDDPTLHFVDILVPGYGLCWVRRSETLVIETTPLTEWTLDQHAIRTMDFQFYHVDEVELSWLCELVGLIGAPVETLHLSRKLPNYDWEVNQGYLSIEQLGALVRSCPRLETLSLEDVEVEATSLVELYEFHSCRIKTIGLSGKHYMAWYDTVNLLICLSDSSNEITQTLEELSLDIAHYMLARGEEELMAALFTMLTDNHVLKKVHLHVPTSQLAKYDAQFRELREKVVCVGAIPLPTRAKCALLSVVDLRATALESGILASVLEYAAECVPRVATITETTLEEQVHWNTWLQPRDAPAI